MLAHFNTTAGPPGAYYLTKFKDLSLLELGLLVVACFFKYYQAASNWVKDCELQCRLSWLLLLDQLKCIKLSNHRRDGLYFRLFKFFDELDSFDCVWI